MRVIGLDLSLTATGVAQIGPGATPHATLSTIRSRGKRDDDLAQRTRRLVQLAADIVEQATNFDVAVIEQPAFAQTGGSHHDRSGLWWLVVAALVARDIAVNEVPPTTLKKYVVGRGNASKMEVMAKLIRRMPSVEINNDNEADALGLALMGVRKYATPIDGVLPKTNLEAMEAVRWIS